MTRKRREKMTAAVVDVSKAAAAVTMDMVDMETTIPSLEDLGGYSY